MKVRLKPLVAGLCFAGFMTTPVMADTNNMQLAELSSQAKSLQLQIASLQKEMHSLKYRVKTTKKVSSKKSVSATDDAQPKKMNGRDLIKLISEEKDYLPFDLDVPGQAFVSTGPYVGVPLQYSGSNLIVNSPSVNTDVQLLGIRKSILHHLDAMGGEIVKEPFHSHLLLSGVVEGQANYLNHSGPTNGGFPSTNIDVTNVSLDAFFLGPSDWSLGFVELTYDNGTPANSIYTSSSASTPSSSYNSYTMLNSRVFVNKAFITIGDLDKSPLYSTFGQFYVPFGTYSSIMITDPFTKSLGRTKARSILFGLQQQDKNAMYAAAFIFRGDSHAASVDKVNNGGLNVGYKYSLQDGFTNGDFGGGVIANLADSAGMQIGNGFSSASGNEQIVHRVPAYNLHGNFAFGEHVDFIAEFVGAGTSFNPNDMSFNGHGARPWAVDAEAAYSFYIFDNRPSSLGIGYEKSSEALSLGLPANRYSLVMSSSLFRNTLQTIEFRRDHEYPASYVATGGGGVASSAETGKFDNAVTASFDYYF